ncbi:PEBP-like protein, partial [Aspergillus japonicus CBS 114.51]
AQTPPDFIYRTENTLIVNYAGKVLETPGNNLSVSDTLAQPTIGLQQNKVTGPFVFVMVDPSLNDNSGATDALHMVQTDLYLVPAPTTVDGVTFYQLTASCDPLAAYLTPNPLIGTEIHYFTQLLFEQPSNLEIPAKYAWYWADTVLNRVNFPLQEFVDDVGFGEPVAANYFL